MSDLKELIERELESFIEWDGDDKSIVTTTSAKLFAEHVAKIYADHVAGARKMVAAVQGEPVAYLRKDQLRQVQRMGPMLGEIADSPRVDRVPVYAASQPAEQQPDVAQLVEALESAKNLIANHSGEVLPDEYAGDQIEQIDGALGAYREGGDV